MDLLLEELETQFNAGIEYLGNGACWWIQHNPEELKSLIITLLDVGKEPLAEWLINILKESCHVSNASQT